MVPTHPILVQSQRSEVQDTQTFWTRLVKDTDKTNFICTLQAMNSS